MKGYSRARKIDVHLHKDYFNNDTFKVTEEDRNLPLRPWLGNEEIIPFTRVVPLTPNGKTKGKRIDFGIAVYSTGGVKLKVFGDWTPDGRFKHKRRAPLVFKQAKGISHQQFIKWIGEIAKYQVCYFYIYIIFIYKM
jgi:hypothetical protein